MLSRTACSHATADGADTVAVATDTGEREDADGGSAPALARSCDARSMAPLLAVAACSQHGQYTSDAEPRKRSATQLYHANPLSA